MPHLPLPAAPRSQPPPPDRPPCRSLWSSLLQACATATADSGSRAASARLSSTSPAGRCTPSATASQSRQFPTAARICQTNRGRQQAATGRHTRQTQVQHNPAATPRGHHLRSRVRLFRRSARFVCPPAAPAPKSVATPPAPIAAEPVPETPDPAAVAQPDPVPAAPVEAEPRFPQLRRRHRRPCLRSSTQSPRSSSPAPA
jgi:hypothetical protein